MPKNVFRGLIVVVGALFLYGCASSGKVEVRRYVEVKDRIDQEMEEGNAGYISGTPQPEDRSDIRKTRKIYVLEVSKEDAEEEKVVIEDTDTAAEESYLTEEDSDYTTEDEDTLETMDLRGDLEDNMAEEMEDTDVSAPAALTTAAGTEYTILKDDTLQKISKKFYGSYSKWSKIYEANKAVIPDPDRIKPGVVIRIPAL
jgi:nucleoid-associated protein YgaU